MIPLYLHFIWIQGWAHCPIGFRHNIESCSGGMTVMFWDDASIQELMRTNHHLTDVLRLYNEESVMAAKADLARYAILYGAIVLPWNCWQPMYFLISI